MDSSIGRNGIVHESGLVRHRAALLWRLHQDLNSSRREQVERTTLRTVGGCFIALAAFILYESGSTLIRHEAPERSIPGIIVCCRLGGRHADTSESETPGCDRDRKRSLTSGYPVNSWCERDAANP
jgi:hypothetical protein